MTIPNPFSQTRFEYEGTHLYYLPQKVIETLEQPKPVYLIGTRGTGKTTLLKSLSWDERLHNDSLQSALNGCPFQKCFIGLYFKLAGRLPHHFSNWLAGDQREGVIFSLYVDLLWLEELTKAIATLSTAINSPMFQVSPDDEAMLVDQVLCDYPILKNWKQFPMEPTLSYLSDLFRLMRRTLQQASMDRTDIADIMNKYPSEQIGEFGRKMARTLGDFCDQHSSKETMGEKKPVANRHWYFKVCIDEAEWYSKEQDIIINTMVRLSEWPTFFVVSYVRDRQSDGDISSTVSQGITLSDADRTLIPLDNITNEDPLFFDGVATVRMRTVLKKPDVEFSIKKLLGRLDINALLQLVIDDSKSANADRWIRKAQELQTTAFWSKKTGCRNDEDAEPASDESESLPIYQSYVIEKLGQQELLYLKPGQSGWAQRGQKKAEIRKRMVAAYLCLCRELGRRDVPYAYAEMLKQMSDNCVRDFLNQINEIYVRSKLSLPAFLEKPVSVKNQHAALVSASMNKRQSIPRSRAPHPKELGRIVEGLGYITQRLQNDATSDATLKSSERGRFVLNFNNGNSLHKSIREYIEEGIENGYICLVREQGSTMVVRLHCSLAASFKFSYRGAYADTTGLEPSDIDDLANAEDSAAVETVAECILNRLNGTNDSNQMKLFGELAE